MVTVDEQLTQTVTQTVTQNLSKMSPGRVPGPSKMTPGSPKGHTWAPKKPRKPTEYPKVAQKVASVGEKSAQGCPV